MTDKSFPMSDRALDLIAHRFKLLSEPMRLRLLQLLMNGEKSVNELKDAAGTTQANVSKHLSILADGGLIARRKEGVTTFYHIADPSLFTLCSLVCNSLQSQGQQVLESLQSDNPKNGD